MADYKSTSAKITVVEASNANLVPYKPGQLIIEDSGNCFYDISTQTTASTGRKSLSSLTDLTQYIKDSELLAKIQNLYGSVSSGNNNPVSGGQVYNAIQSMTSGGSQLPQITDISSSLPTSGVYYIKNCAIPTQRISKCVWGSNGVDLTYLDGPSVSGILICSSEGNNVIISSDGKIYSQYLYDGSVKYKWCNHSIESCKIESVRTVSVTHSSATSSVTCHSPSFMETLDVVIYEIGSDMNIKFSAPSLTYSAKLVFLIKVVGNNAKISFDQSNGVYFINGSIPKIEKDKTYMVTMYGSWAIEVNEIVQGTYVTADDVSYTS